jgi:pimeloyl-ACP methyl ester carboxylesterase
VAHQSVERQLLNQPGSGQVFWAFRKNELGWSGLRTYLSYCMYILASRANLLIHDERDRVVSIEWTRRARECIPESGLCVFEECGHRSPRKCVDEFNRMVTGFLAR